MRERGERGERNRHTGRERDGQTRNEQTNMDGWRGRWTEIQTIGGMDEHRDRQ